MPNTTHATGTPSATYAYLPTALATDPAATAPAMKLLIVVQGHGAAVEWTPPLPTVELARTINASVNTVKRSVQWLMARGYLERAYVGGPRGGRIARYHMPVRGLPIRGVRT